MKREEEVRDERVDESSLMTRSLAPCAGRPRSQHGEERDEDPVQNDWNGPAKVALRFTRDPDAAHIARELQRLRPEVEEEFPNAWRFVRPGFDQDVRPSTDTSP